MRRWEEAQRPTQNVLSAGTRPLVAIRVTSLPEHPRPWFAVCKPVREEFAVEMIEFLFGRQPCGAPHTWEQLAIVSAIAASQPPPPEIESL